MVGEWEVPPGWSGQEVGATWALGRWSLPSPCPHLHLACDFDQGSLSFSSLIHRTAGLIQGHREEMGGGSASSQSHRSWDTTLSLSVSKISTTFLCILKSFELQLYLSSSGKSSEAASGAPNPLGVPSWSLRSLRTRPLPLTSYCYSGLQCLSQNFLASSAVLIIHQNVLERTML